MIASKQQLKRLISRKGPDPLVCVKKQPIVQVRCRNPFASINVAWNVFIWKHLVLLILPTLSLLQRKIRKCQKGSPGTLTGHFMRYTFPVQGHRERKVAGEPVYVYIHCFNAGRVFSDTVLKT